MSSSYGKTWGPPIKQLTDEAVNSEAPITSFIFLSNIFIKENYKIMVNKMTVQKKKGTKNPITDINIYNNPHSVSELTLLSAFKVTCLIYLGSLCFHVSNK